MAPIVKRTPFADQRIGIFILRGARCKRAWWIPFEIMV
jgi:hypothetical protein